jgi:hypothetical protein
VLANYAVYASDTDTSAGLPDYNDVYGDVDGELHTTTGVAEYLLDPGAISTVTGSVYFHMEYTPFSMDDHSAWTDWAEFSAVYHGAVPDTSAQPVWVIRNGLNDLKQTPAVFDTATGELTDYGTDFAHYTSTGTADDGKLVNANGAVSIGVVNPTIPLAGLFVDNNPWPIGGPDIYWQEDEPMTAAVGDLDYKPTLEVALTQLNALLGAATLRRSPGPQTPQTPTKTSTPTSPERSCWGIGSRGRLYRRSLSRASVVRRAHQPPPSP